jgi:hypothetical protein
LAKIEEELKKENNEKKSDELKKNVRNTYKWLLKKEEARAKAKGPEPEEIKAQAIVIFYLQLVGLVLYQKIKFIFLLKG